MKYRSSEALVMANPTPAPGMGPKEHSWAIVPYVKSRREAQIDELVRHSFELQKAEARLFPFSAPVTIIHGTSSVGKSSIIAGMRASIPELEELGADLLGHQIALKYIKDHHPETYAFLNSALVAKNNNMHILDAVSGGVFHFKATTTALEREEADRRAREISGEVARAVRLPGEEIDHIMLDKAMSYAADKSPVIFDILNIERVFGHTLGKMPMRVALVYCPIDTLVARIQNRNRSAFESQELSKVRLGESPLVQLGEIFRPKVLDEEAVIFSITREQVERGFDALFEEWAQVTRTSYTSTEKAGRLDRVLNSLGFTEPSVIRLEYTPRFKGYDFVIDTSVVDSRSAAKILARDVAPERDLEEALLTLSGKYHVGLLGGQQLEVSHFNPAEGRETVGLVGIDIYVPTIEEDATPVTLSVCGKVEAAYTHSRSIKSFEGLEVEERKPVIVFSHGYQFDPSEYRPIIEELTSQGFVCLVLDHPANSASGRFGPQLDEGKEYVSPGVLAPDAMRMDVRSHLQTDDMLSVISGLKSHASALRGLSSIADTDSVILMGHSLGGGAAVDAARQDGSIKGVINLDGALRGDKARDAIEVPALTLVSGRKYSLPPPSNPDEERMALESEAMRTDWEEFSRSSLERNPKTKISYIPEADHMDFSIAPFLQWRDGLVDSLADCRTTHQTVLEEILRFVDSLNE